MQKKLNNALIKTVDKANDTVGILFDGKQINILVPQVFNLDLEEKDLKKNLILFLKSLAIAKTLNYSDINKSKNNGDCWPIESYLWIIRDYLENGFFYNREKVFSKDRKGKIEWKRTLRTIPFISDNNIIYNDIVTSRMSASNDIVAQIYKLCLKQSQNRIGWLFNYNFRVDVQQIRSTKEMIYIINNELKSTFDDIKRLRFKHMLAILNLIDNDESISSVFTYTIDNYYYVFEVMVDKMFQGIDGKEKNKYNPEGYWKLNGQEERLASNLRPDTIYKSKDITVIIDAKMYQYGATHNVNDLPETTSIQKQITYGDFVYNKVGEKNVRNVFILPYNKKLECFKNDKNIEMCDNDNFVYFGKAYVNWRNELEFKAYENIYAFMIDFEYLLKNYDKNENRYITNLCKKIEEIEREN